MDQKAEHNTPQLKNQNQSIETETTPTIKLPPYHTLPLYPVPTESVVADIDRLCSLPFWNNTYDSSYSVSAATNPWLQALRASTNYYLSVANLPRCYFPHLITAPTGSGKTQFAIKDLASVAAIENRDVLLIVNRRILREQLVQMTEEHFLGFSPPATVTRKKALPASGILSSALISSLLGTSKKSLKNLSIILKHHTAACYTVKKSTSVISSWMKHTILSQIHRLAGTPRKCFEISCV